MAKPKKWARNSLILSLYKKSSNFFTSKKILKEKAHCASQLKHTFFPGNKIHEKRLFNPSNFIIDCDSPGKVIWDIIILLLTISLSFLIPYSLSFYSDFSIKLWFVVFIFYSVDMILTFNTSYYANGFRVTRRRKILIHYIGTWFFFDFLSTFPFEYFYLSDLDFRLNYPQEQMTGLDEIVRYLLILKLLRMLKLKKVIFSVQELFPVQIVYSLTSLLTYFLASALPIHLMVCIYNVLYCKSLHDSYENYVDVYYDTKVRYYHFLLRAVETMTSVGYGEFPVKSTDERIFCIFAMSLTSGLLGYFVGGIESAVEKSNRIDFYFRNINQKTVAYCKFTKIKNDLKKKILNFLRNLKFLYQSNLIQEEDILNLLSSPLRNEIFTIIRGNFLITVPLFNEFSSQCLGATGYYLKLEMYGPEDIIIKQTQFTNEIYFVVSGDIEIFHYSTKTTFKILSKNEYFGELGFFLNIPRTASAKSEGFSELLVLKRYDFLKILKTMPKDKEKFEVIYRNFKNYGLRSMKINCYLCKSFNHVCTSCDKYLIPKSSDFKTQNAKLIKPNKHFGAFYKYRSIEPRSFLTKMNIYNTKGSLEAPTKLFKENWLLAKKAEDFNHWHIGATKRNSRILTILSEAENFESSSSSENSENDSDSSRENFVQFELARSERFGSIFSAESGYIPNWSSRRGSVSNF